MRILTELECKTAMEKGKFELPEISGTEGLKKAALILTQSWCPQWKAMKNYLPDAEKQMSGLKTVYIEYDLVPFFEKFMTFKENTFNNREIPYVRYFTNGECTDWSNYVSIEGFLQRLK